MLTNINHIFQLLLSQFLYTLWNIFHENERNFIIVMSVTKLPLIGWSIIKMVFNDLTFDRAQLGLPSNFMKAKYYKSSELEKNLILNQQTFTFSKTLFCLALKRFVGPGETHHRKQRERGQFSPLWRGLCRKQDPLPTWDCSLLLSSLQSNLWKGCTGRLWIFNIFLIHVLM